MSNDPNGFEENPQSPLAADEENIIDEAIFGPPKVLTEQEQAAYDDWLRKKVGHTLQKIKDGKATFTLHEEVVAEMKAYLEQLDREAGTR